MTAFDGASVSTGETSADPALTLIVHEHDQAIVVEVCGALDLLTAPRLRETMLTVLTQRPVLLVIDLSAVNFLSSAGMSVLVETQYLAGHQVRLHVVAAGATTLRPLQVTGLNQLLTLYPTREAALTAD
jgi:anti-anti-sigma factor